MDSFKLERDDILMEAVENCYREMFAKAQPMADWDNIIEEFRAGKISKDDRIYERHYLSAEEYTYIINKYISAYRIGAEWRSNIELLESYLKDGGLRDKYNDAYTDEDGNHHPGWRSAETVDPLYKHIEDIINSEYGDTDKNSEDVSKKITDKVMELIGMCKNFYRLNSDELKFRNTIAFGATPTTNKETVKKWWKENYDVDIDIEEKNPLLLWEYDYYGDEMDSIMTEEYGDDWKKIWDEKWQKEQEEKRKKYEELIKSVNNESD